METSPLYSLPRSVETRWASPENPDAMRGAGGRAGGGRKGAAWLPLAPGESTVLAHADGPGTVRRLWATISDRSPAMLRGLVLRAGLAVSPGALMSMAASVSAGRFATAGRAPTAITVGGFVMTLAALWLVVQLGPEPEFLAVWLPAGVISGAGLGLLLTGVATTSSGALPPTSFAAGTGLVLTARQVGGGVGIAIGASLLTSTPGMDGYILVYGLCGAAAAVAGLGGAWLSRRASQARQAAAGAGGSPGEARALG